MSVRTPCVALLVAVPVALRAQTDSGPPLPPPSPVAVATAPGISVPFGIGERLVYDVKFGPLKVGEGTMEVIDVENIRGRAAWHTRFRVRGGLLFYRVDDVLESWFDVQSFHSVRFVQDYEEGGRVRERRFEIYPERRTYQEGDKEELPSVIDPLDEGAFLYYVRTIPLEVGRTYTLERYYRPDRNPLILKVLRRETLVVPAGRFDAIVIQPIVKSRGIFKEDSHAQVWLSDDKDRIILQMKSNTSIGSLSLYLKSHRPPRSE
jgi:hypothetical protein